MRACKAWHGVVWPYNRTSSRICIAYDERMERVRERKGGREGRREGKREENQRIIRSQMAHNEMIVDEKSVKVNEFELIFYALWTGTPAVFVVVVGRHLRLISICRHRFIDILLKISIMIGSEMSSYFKLEKVLYLSLSISWRFNGLFPYFMTHTHKFTHSTCFGWLQIEFTELNRNSTTFIIVWRALRMCDMCINWLETTTTKMLIIRWPRSLTLSNQHAKWAF